MRGLLNLRTCSSVLGHAAVETRGGIGQWCKVSVYIHLQDSIGNCLPLTIIYHRHVFLKTLDYPMCFKDQHV